MKDRKVQLSNEATPVPFQGGDPWRQRNEMSLLLQLSRQLCRRSLMTTDEYIIWAQAKCPATIATNQGALEEAMGIYDDVDNRLGDDAEDDDFLSRILWLEVAMRLAGIGWRIEELEAARWPFSFVGNVTRVLQEMD